MNSDAIYAKFGRLVFDHRRRRNLTQQKLGELVGLSRTSITNIEKGRQKILFHQIFDFATALGTSAEALLPVVMKIQELRDVDRKLPNELSAAEKDWVHQLLISPLK